MLNETETLLRSYTRVISIVTFANFVSVKDDHLGFFSMNILKQTIEVGLNLIFKPN